MYGKVSAGHFVKHTAGIANYNFQVIDRRSHRVRQLPQLIPRLVADLNVKITFAHFLCCRLQLGNSGCDRFCDVEGKGDTYQHRQDTDDDHNDNGNGAVTHTIVMGGGGVVYCLIHNGID